METMYGYWRWVDGIGLDVEPHVESTVQRICTLSPQSSNAYIVDIPKSRWP